MLGTASLGPTSNVSFVLYGGGRVNWLSATTDGTITIRASANVGEIGQSFNFSTSKGRAYIEPMIGLKTSWALGPKVKAILRGDVGGFGCVTIRTTGIAISKRRSPGKPGTIPISISAIAPAVNGRITARMARAYYQRLVLWPGTRRDLQLLTRATDGLPPGIRAPEKVNRIKQVPIREVTP